MQRVCSYSCLIGRRATEQVACDLVTSTVHVAFLQQAKHGIHHAIMSGDFHLTGMHGSRDETGHTDFINVRVVAEGTLDVAHVAATTGNDDATQQLVDVLVRHLEPDVLNDFLQSTLNDIDEVAAHDGAILIDRERQRVVDIAIIGEGTAILQFHALGIGLLHLQGGNILRDVVASQWDNSQMAKDVLVVDAYRRSVSTEVDEHAASTLLGLCQHTISHGQRCQIHLCNGDASLIETLVEVTIERLPPEDVQEIAFETRTLNAHGV